MLPTEDVVSQDWCVSERLKDGVHEAGVAEVEQSLETWHERKEALHLTTHIAPEHSKCLPSNGSDYLYNKQHTHTYYSRINTITMCY